MCDKSCYTCTHYDSWKEYESWEMPHINWRVYACSARPSIVNLKQFPFEHTNCKDFRHVSNKAVEDS